VNYARFKQSSYRLIAVAKQGCFIYWMMSFILILLLKCHLIYDPSLLREQVDTTVLGLDADRAKEMPYIASMGIYVVSKEAMISLLRDDFPDANDFGSEVIPGATKLGRKVW
jgi:hypothetical protein